MPRLISGADLLNLGRHMADLETAVAALSPSPEAAAVRTVFLAQPASTWREEQGAVLWWRFPVVEPPYVGTPLNTDWPGDLTHWTEIAVPPEPGGAEQ